MSALSSVVASSVIVAWVLSPLFLFTSITSLATSFNPKGSSVNGYSLSIGNNVEGINEKDIIYYDKHAGHGIQHNDKFYQVIKQIDVVLID